jgi:hypothetical protein
MICSWLWFWRWRFLQLMDPKEDVFLQMQREIDKWEIYALQTFLICCYLCPGVGCCCVFNAYFLAGWRHNSKVNKLLIRSGRRQMKGQWWTMHSSGCSSSPPGFIWNLLLNFFWGLVLQYIYFWKYVGFDNSICCLFYLCISLIGYLWLQRKSLLCK